MQPSVSGLRLSFLSACLLWTFSLFWFDNRRHLYPILRLFVMDRIGMSVSESQDV